MLSIPSPVRSRRALWAAGCAVAALALSPAVASADSLAYVKDGNVWLADGSGGSQYQVTLDGTAEDPTARPRRPTTARSPRASAPSRTTGSATTRPTSATRDGKKLVAVRGYDASTHIAWYTVNGNVLSGGKPPAPDAFCMTGRQAGFDSPTWAPDGDSLAWSEPDGIWVKRRASECGEPQPTLVLPGGSEADWGPANVNPGPRSTADTGGQQGGGAPTPLAIQVKPARGAKLKVRKRAVKVALTCPAECRYEVKLMLRGRKVAGKAGTAKADRTTTVTLKLRGKQARAVRKLGRRSKALKLSISATAGTAGTVRTAVVAPR